MLRLDARHAARRRWLANKWRHFIHLFNQPPTQLKIYVNELQRETLCAEQSDLFRKSQHRSAFKTASAQIVQQSTAEILSIQDENKIHTYVSLII